MNRLLKHIFVLSLCVFAAIKSYGQQPVRRLSTAPVYGQRTVIMAPQRANPAMQRVNAIRENFFNRQLKLTPEESERFWPTYRQYQSELAEVRRLRRLNNSTETPNGSDQINNELKYQSQLLEIRKRYNEEFLKILPPEKVSELYKSEHEFNDEVVRQLSERQAARRGD